MNTPYLPLGLKVLWQEGIPDDTLIVEVPRTKYWLEFKMWSNKRFRIALCDTQWERKRILKTSASIDEVTSMIEFACMPHKEPWQVLQFLEAAKQKLKQKGSINPFIATHSL